MGWTGYWHGLVAPLLGLGFMVACMVLMYFVMRGHVRHVEQALEILRKRFARGEISQEEFENRRRVLDA
jgi:uncharacterized membrane protein